MSMGSLMENAMLAGTVKNSCDDALVIMRFSVPLSIHELSQPQYGLLLDAIESLESDDVVRVTESQSGCVLESKFSAWSAFGGRAVGEGDDDIESLQVEKAFALERLFPLPAGKVSFRLEGLPGMKSGVCRVFVNGVEVVGDLGTEGVRGISHPPSFGPIFAYLIDQAVAYGRATDRRGGLVRLARVARAVRVLQRTCAPALAFEIPPSIEKHESLRAIGVRFSVLEDEHAGWVRVCAEVTDERGENTVVSSRSLDSSGAFLQTSDGKLVELTDVQSTALREMRPHVVARADALKTMDALEHPERLLSPEALDATMEFIGYSERVLGFGPVSASELLPKRIDYGVRWYDEDDNSASQIFLVISACTGEREMTTLPLETREKAEALLEACDAAIMRGMQHVTVDGVDVSDPASLAPVLRDAIRERLERDQRESAVQGARGPQPTLAAQLANAQRPSHGTRCESTEPDWNRLAEVLASGVTIKEHQREGIRWLWSRYVHSSGSSRKADAGAVLADDMGLGKTLQIACFLALTNASHIVDRRPSLIIAPKILLRTWARELEKFFRPKELFIRTFSSSELAPGRGALVEQDGRIRSRALEEHSIWSTNYETLQAYGEKLARVEWNVVVLDEAQAIKNPMTAVSRNIRALKRRFAITATGTPIENRLSDLFPLADFSAEGLLAANARDFDERYRHDDASAVARLRAELRIGCEADACLLRREKRHIARDLPRKLERVVMLEMTPEQRSLEANLVRAARGSATGRLRLIGELQKLYQHPRLLFGAGELGESVHTLVDESPKLAWLKTELHARRAANDKVLIFALWRRMQDIIRCMLEAEFPDVMQQRNVTINGEPDSVARAEQRIDTFSATPGFDVLILSPKVAGTGLTITAANHVIHYGRWWNPAREDQASDRAYRIGQTRDVYVHIPVVHHPGEPSRGFDVALHELVTRKRELAADFLSPNRGDLTAADLDQIQDF